MVKETKKTDEEPAKITPSPTQPAEPKDDPKEAAENSEAKAEAAKIVPPVEENPLEEPEDYLRQYQYRKGAVFGSKDSDPQPGSKAEKMKKHLLAQDRIRTFIPREGKKADDYPHSVTLNAYRLDFPRQTYIELPEQIANVIADALDQDEAAILRNQISASKDKEAALL